MSIVCIDAIAVVLEGLLLNDYQIAHMCLVFYFMALQCVVYVLQDEDSVVCRYTWNICGRTQKKGTPNMEKWNKRVKEEMNDWVALYRRQDTKWTGL